ncbi:proton-conducting transporter membrane subunit [Proteinivorax hydrogeniformans]|uniref:Proton-conducting transporter membrane subunit n=1 Tax=Proteinivorax hydrogeniformans TaxID=1826727 RepID=A0AAU8HTC2_9FIRM
MERILHKGEKAESADAKNEALTVINNVSVIALSALALVVILSMEFGYFSGFKEVLIDTIFNFRFYPLLIILFPIIFGVLAVGMFSNHEQLRDILVVDITFLTFIMILLLYPVVREEAIFLRISELLGYGINIRIDMTSLVIALLSSFIWLMVTIYAPDYMNKEAHRNRFYLFLMLTFGFILGTVMSGCVFTTFLFFEAMTFSSYMLVVHCETKECIEAGNSYIYMGIMGGLCILLAMILLFINVGTLEYANLAIEMQNLGGLEYFIMGLFIIGFGVKAGLAPLHIWLPKAHPIAPTPASALLSGIMVKIGAYGIIRTTTSFFFPEMHQVTEGFSDSIWISAQTLGAIIIWLGIATMGLGVFMALQQGNIKKMLAFHSVSQMGYIIMGIGVAVYLGYKGAMGYSGAMYHIINHALFKSLLFMVTGAVYLKVGTLDMYKMGGLWRKMPFTFAVSTVAALGITGMPLFNGFASKTLLHHAIEEAFIYGHPSFKIAEVLFIIISAGTACSFIKWTSFIFLGKSPKELENVKGEFPMMNIAMAGLALVIVLIGIFPNFLLDIFIVPAASAVTYDPEFINNYIVDMNIFATSDLLGMIPVYVMGGIIFYLGIKYQLFHLHFPKWFSIEGVLILPFVKLKEFVVLLSHKVSTSKHADTFYSANSVVVEDKRERLQHLNAYSKGTINGDIEEASLIEKFVKCVDKEVNKCEISFINSDVIIYSIILTFLLVFFFMVK